MFKVCNNIITALLLGCITLSSCQNKKKIASSDSRLWYNHPAKTSVLDNENGWKDDSEWLRALPLGNGQMGAMVFGGVNKERIQLNEETMWSGSHENSNNIDAYKSQNEIRKLLFNGQYSEATKLTQKTQICIGKGSGRGNGAEVPFGCYQTLGDLRIDFKRNDTYSNYHKELDLEEAIVRVHYNQGGVQYKREIFISRPDKVMVMRLTANRPGMISFNASLSRPEKANLRTHNNQLIMHGSLSNGKGGDGLQYITRLTALNKKGHVKYTNSNITVENADEVILLLSSSTNYVMQYPHYKGRNHTKETLDVIEESKDLSFQELFERHKTEYQNYYNRVNFELLSSDFDTIPTDIRLKENKIENTDLKLVELLFQYGRYLLISSSRPGTLPANLQGIWANKIQTPWNGDYHTDINLQMNYWLAESANLSEMHLPLFDLIESLSEPGQKTAKIHYNADGWVVHPITNIWGFTSPGELSDWGMHVGAGAWLTTHIMEHYNFTLDKPFLEKFYPILRASVKFYMDWLVMHPNTGELLSGPSVSPENKFLAPDGSISKISMGPAHDQQVIWQLFNDFIQASQVLRKDKELLESVIQTQRKMAKPKIAKDGRLMEWDEEFKEIEPGHRHISHLYALHPGCQIDLIKTPDLALAAKKSLNYRLKHGSGHTGWSSAWLINLYARLGDSEKAYEALCKLMKTNINTNLFGSHPPFQIDANFGATAGIIEMLLQSHSGEIRLLPALPKAWRSGEINGICARGGFTIDMKWKLGKLTYLKVFSKEGGHCKLHYNGREIYFMTKKNSEYFPLNDF